MIGVSEDDLRVIAEHGYEGAARTDHDQQAQAVSLSITDMLAVSIGQE
jgi:fructose/tagatose bisphosphate aldolase